MGEIIKRYVLWNNKGGVGKSTLAFHVGSLYAEKHPDKKILVLDMCPQANATMMYLGGGMTGENNLIELQQKDIPRTIVGFFNKQLQQMGSLSAVPNNIDQFLLQVSAYNSNIPDNMFIVPGDGNLEVILSPMSYYANPQAMTNTWRNVLMWVRDLCDIIAQEIDGEIVVFIDTNPSFAIYTQQSILAADEIIVPFNADDSSRTGIGALFGLIYGMNIPHPVYQNYTFESLAKQAKLKLPLVHLFVGNRFAQFQGVARAFEGLASVIRQNAWVQYQKNPSNFTSRSVPIHNLDDFSLHYYVDLRDFNSAGVIAANQGIPLSKLQSGQYSIYDKTAQVNPDQVTACRNAIDSVVSRL